MAFAFDAPEGFEPVAPANSNQPAASDIPAGFESVPVSELHPIDPNPPAYQQRLLQGEALERMMAKSYSQRLAEWTAGKIKEGSYGQAAVGTLATTAASVLQFPFDFAKQFNDYVRDKNAQLPPSQQPEETLNQGLSVGFNGAMLTMGSGTEFSRPVSPLIVDKNGQAARIVVDQQGNQQLHLIGDFPPKQADFDAAATNIAARASNALPEGFELKQAGDQFAIERTEHGINTRYSAGATPQEALNNFNQSHPEAAANKQAAISIAANDNIRSKLLDAWHNEGLHPAELAADAEKDAFLAHDLSSAAANPTDIPPLVSPDVQPLSAAGKIASDLKTLVGQTFDVGRWVQRELAPISAAPDPAIRLATEYLSNLRRSAWDWNRYDKKITDTLNPEQRQAVWRAMDEESVMAQSGEHSEHMGLATLSPQERAIADELSRHAMTTRMQMLDRGMVTTEGLPHYVPRVFKGTQKGEPISLGAATRIREKTGSMMQRKYLNAEESEAAAKERLGPKAELVRDIRVLPMVLAKQQKAIAAHDFIEGVRKLGQDTGDPQIIEGEIPKGDETKWFTVPDSDLADWHFRSNGDLTIATKVPMHIKAEWAPAIKAIANTKFNNWDKFIVETKNRPISLIMNSPFIHDSVVFSKALPSNPGNLLTFKFMRHGPQLLQDEKFMRDMIDGGLVLWGRRAGFKQDVSSIMEEPQFDPGRSFTAKALAYVPGLFSEKAGTGIKRAIDAAGEFVHDKLLGEQVQKLQVSLAYDFRETLRKKFPMVPDDVLNVLAAHEGNRFGGSLPAEAMSAWSRGVSNALLFSRQFTLGNLGILKDAAKGPPEYVMARVRDMLGPEGAEKAEQLRGAARRHAFSVVMLDLAMYAVGNSLIQTGVDLASGTPMSDEVAGYWFRLQQAAKRIEEHPFSPSSYLTFFPSLSPTFYHEPGKEGKILLGYREDGTAIYGRSVLGRMGEDYIGLFTHPASYLLTKMAPMPRALLEMIENSDNYGKPIYDPKALREGDVWQAWNLAKHFVEAELPMQQITGAANLASGKGDYKDAVNTFGPYMPPPFTVTGSQGYPGGPAAGVIAGHQRDERVAQDLAMSQVKDMVVNKGDIAGARELMKQLGVKPGLQNFLIRNWQHPGLSKLSPRTLSEFYRHASPIEIDILNSTRAH